jgi:hypothetical protein
VTEFLPVIQPTFYSVSTGFVSLQVKHQLWQGGHCPLTSAEVQNELRCTCTSACFRGVDRDGFTSSCTLKMLYFSCRMQNKLPV